MTPSGPTVGPASTSQRLASGPIPTRCGQAPICTIQRGLGGFPDSPRKGGRRRSRYRWSRRAPTAGELKMMSPVAYDHLSVPSRPTPYSLPSCEPTSTEPSAATAGDDTIGPPVANVHQTAGLTAGSTNGERPRWVGPKRNIAWAGSIAYCGSGNDGPPSPAPPPMGARCRPATRSGRRRTAGSACSPCRTRTGVASTWAQPTPDTTRGGHTEGHSGPA